MRRGLLVVAALLLVACTGRPTPAPGDGLAAVAFRDAVPSWQRLGTRGFTRHYLEDGYDQVIYLDANSPDAPDDQALRDALTRAASQNRAVDLFLLVNGGRQVEWVASLPASVRAKLRLVYDTGAGAGEQARAWAALGSRAFVAHPGPANLAPFFYVDFLRDWVAGESLQQAVADGNAALHDRLSGWSAPTLLELSGFPARARDLPWWEDATRAQVIGDGSFALR